MSAFERLGLEPTADEREIKRAYARELRRTRPDEDPAGFQALNEAYQQCLAYAEHQREQASLDDEAEAGGGDAFDTAWQARDYDALETSTAVETTHEATARHRPAAPASGQTTLSFDLHAFLDELLQRARSQSPAELKRWLLNLEPLYSLDLTRALRGPVAQTASQAEPALSPSALATVFDFFSLNLVGANDGWLLEQAHQAQHRAESKHAFEQALAQLQSPQTRSVDRLLLRELLEPLSPGRRLLIALVAGLPTRLMEMVSALRRIDPQSADQRLNPGTIEYWRQVTDRGRLYWRRAFVALSRIVLYPLLLLSAVAALAQRTDLLGRLPDIWLLCGSVWLLQCGAKAWLPRLVPLLDLGNPDPGLPIGRDRPLWLVGSLAVMALTLMPFASGIATLIVLVTGLIWLLARGAPLIGRTFMAMAAGAIAAACLPSCLDALVGVRDTAPPDPWVPLYLLIGVAMPVLQDLHRAKHHRLSLQTAREQARWFWPLLIAAAALLIVRGSLVS